jgi:hypothetical protein
MYFEIGSTFESGSDRMAAKTARRSEDLGWTLRLLQATGLGISLFRLKLHGLAGSAAARGYQILIDRLADEALVERRDDGSALVLVIRYDDSEERATTRLAARLAAVMRDPDWPLHAVAELIGVHHHAAEIGHVSDLLSELSYAPRRMVEPNGTIL